MAQEACQWYPTTEWTANFDQKCCQLSPTRCRDPSEIAWGKSGADYICEATGVFTDTAKVDKWFRRNCNDVLSRECTAMEKADVWAYLKALKP